MTIAASPVAESIAGDLIVYFVLPLLVALTIGIVTYVVRMGKRQNITDSALQLLILEVNPPNKPSLRDLITDVRAKQGIDSATFTLHTQREDERYLDLKAHSH